jgi:hypothetical protein
MMKVREMEVDPDLAVRWLEGNVHNRKLREDVVTRYARDMKAGRWMLTHECIAFDRDSVLVDGQHRCWAVIESGATIRCMVAFEVEIDTQAVIDGGLPRNMVDVMHLSYGEKEVASMDIALAKALAQGRATGSLTRQEIVEAFHRYRPAIRFAIESFPRKVRHVTTAPVLTVIARAYYTAERERLTRFSEVLASGTAERVDGEASVILLRNWLLERSPTHGRGKALSHQVAVYGKTERALSAFLLDEKITTLYAATSELFPLPIEKVQSGKVKAPKLIKRKAKEIRAALQKRA